MVPLRAIFLFIWMSVVLVADTIVVDDDVSCIPWFGCYGACESGDVETKTIADALNQVQNGDIVKICAGTYNESIYFTRNIGTLTITSGADVHQPTDVHWINTNYPLRINADINIDISNISLKSDNKYGIYMYKARNVRLQNVIIFAKQSAVYGWNNVNGNYTFLDSSFRSTNKYGIYFKKGTSFTARNVTIDAADHAIYLNNQFDGPFVLEQSSIKSSGGRGVYLKKAKACTVRDSNVSANDEGIYFYQDVVGNHTFENVEVNSSDDGIRIQGALDITMQNVKVNAPSGAGIRLDDGDDITLQNVDIISQEEGFLYASSGNTNGNYVLKDIVVHSSNNEGITITSGKDITIENGAIDAIGYGIYLKNNVSGNYTFKNLHIVSDTTGINIKNGHDVTVQDSNITAQDDGVSLGSNIDGQVKFDKIAVLTKSQNGLKISGADTIEVKNSCLKKQNATNGYDLNINSGNSDSNNPATVQNNCFYGVPLSILARAKYHNTIDPNFWEGLSSGAYSYNNIEDSNPLSICPNDCSYFTQYSLVAEYRMDECCWSGVLGEVNDSSGNGYNGTAYIAVTESNSSVGGILCRVGDFTHISADDSNDSDDDFVQIPKEVMDGLHDFTFMAWIKTNQSGDHKRFTLLSAARATTTYNETWIFFTDKNKFYPWIKGKRNGTVTLDQDLNDNVWHHIVVTREDRGSSGSNVCIVIDGNVSNKKCNSIADSGGALDVAAIVLGQDQDKVLGDYQASQEFNGYMDEVKIFNGIVSDANITAIFNNEKKRFNYDGTQRSCLACIIEEPLLDYKMDECSWDNDVATYEIKNSGSGGNDYNATALSGANTESNSSVGGGLCRVGDFKGKYIEPKNYPPISAEWSMSVWIQFPLVAQSNQFQINGYDYFIIASVDGDGDLGYFAKKTNQNDYKWGVYDNNKNLVEVSLGSIADGWHHIVEVVQDGKTRLYIDGNFTAEVSAYTHGNIKYIGSSTDNTQQETIGTYMDEFKIFNRALSPCDVRRIYQNEKQGKNYDGSPRSCQDCLSKLLIAQWRMDECSWDSDPNSFEVLNDIDTNYNATALYGAKPLPAKVCNGGDIDSAVDGNISLRLRNNFALPQRYTFNVWIRFPFETANHTTFSQNSQNYEYYNIADRVGASNDFIYFEYIDGSGWYLVVDGSSPEGMAFNPQNLTGWHMLTFVVKNGSTDFYFDGDFNHTFNASPNGGNLGLLFNSDYGANDNEPNGQAIGALVDEVKIYQGNLAQSDIQSLLSESRSCPNCGRRSYKFDCWDTLRNEIDRNISTKIVQDRIDLNLAEVDENGTYHNEFNGTVCTTIFDSTSLQQISEWNATHWNNNTPDEDNNQTISFDVDKATKDARVYIYWIENRYETNDSCSGLFAHDGNESNSSDNFAVRPEHFEIEVSTPIYAGEDFNISFYAKDDVNTPATDYNESKDTSFKVEANETKRGCKEENITLDSFSFSDGKAENINANYDDIGEINISIHEINGSEFAKVDEDDTNDSQRLIEENWSVVRVLPYEANVTELNFTTSTQQHWLYMLKKAEQMSEMNITTSVQVGVFSKKGTPLEDFNSSCYGSDVDVKFFYSVDNTSDEDENDISVKYVGTNDDSAATLADINKTITIPAANFSAGKGSASYAFDINRSYNTPLAPVWLQVEDVQIASNIAKLRHSAQDTGVVSGDLNATLYYARVKPFDITTSKQNDSTKTDILVFDDQNSSYTQNLQEILVDWFSMTPHTSEEEGKILQTVVKNGVSMQDSNITSISVSSTLEAGEYNISIANPDRVESAYIHLDISPWLWFSYDYDYSFASSSDCANHPCIRYLYFSNVSGGGIRSGNVKGVRFETNVSKNPRGVKVFR